MINTLEQNARRAKEGMSFSNYKPGSATAEIPILRKTIVGALPKCSHICT